MQTNSAMTSVRLLLFWLYQKVILRLLYKKRHYRHEQTYDKQGNWTAINTQKKVPKIHLADSVGLYIKHQNFQVAHTRLYEDE